MTFITLFLHRSLGHISVLFGQTVKGMSAGARVFEYIQLEPLVPLKGGAVIPSDELAGRVEFKNVTFRYPSRSEQVCRQSPSTVVQCNLY